MGPRLTSTIRAAVLAGLAGGAADILAAFVIYQAPPVRILQTIASGLQGPAAYEGGLASAALGLACHFLIAILFAGLFVAAARPAPVLLRQPALSGLGFGVVVYGVMNAIVVPLSLASSGPPPPPHMIGLGLLAHALFGLALAFTAARAMRGVR